MKRVLFLLPFLAMTIVATTAPAEGPGVGDKVPDTQLRGEDGERVGLRALVDGQPAVLVFYRGGWCPFCTKHLAGMAGIHDEVRENGFQVLAISPDRPAKLAETPDRESLGYRLLSDSTMETARAFGIAFQVPADLVRKYKEEFGIDLEADSGQTHHLLPHPAVYVVAGDGSILFAHVNEDYRERLDPDKVLEAVAEAAQVK